MSGFEETIRGLLLAIPGYRGYEEQEGRRDADKLLRTHLAQQFRAEQQALTRLTQQAVAAGRLDLTGQLGQVNQTIETYISRLETAPRGYAGWFSQAKIDAADLDQIYQFDARLADGVPLLRERISYVAAQLPQGEELQQALTALRDFADGLLVQFDARREFVAFGKRPG